ncbi:MAG: glycosyl hydrolase [Pseudomonadota bacterium]
MTQAVKIAPFPGKLTALMSAVLVLSLVACGGGGDSALPASGSGPAPTVSATDAPAGTSAAPVTDASGNAGTTSTTAVAAAPVTDSATAAAGAAPTVAVTAGTDTTVATPSATAAVTPAAGTAVTAAAAAAIDGRSKKRGLGYGDHSVADMQALSAGVSWWYNWSPKPDSGVVNTYQSVEEFVPMIWGGNPNADDIANQVPNGAKYLLGFNEPNFRSQSNKTPRQAAALWPVLEEVARRKNLQIGAPALNYCGDCVTDSDFNSSDPIVYMDAFLAACKDCKIDFIPVHWYACDLGSLQWYIDKFRKYNKPIWLTEFSCAGVPDITLAKQKAYMTDAVKYLESQPIIARYSWFSGRNNEIPFINLLEPQSGVLSELGRLYVSLPGGTTSTGGGGGAGWSAQIEAENFVEMRGVQNEGSSEGGANVGWIDTGDWMIWDLNTPSAGTYKVEYRVSSPNGGTIRLEQAGGSPNYGSIDVPRTGGWQNWQTISHVVNLPAGQQRIGIAVPAGGFNLNWLKFTKQ